MIVFVECWISSQPFFCNPPPQPRPSTWPSPHTASTTLAQLHDPSPLPWMLPPPQPASTWLMLPHCLHNQATLNTVTRPHLFFHPHRCGSQPTAALWHSTHFGKSCPYQLRCLLLISPLWGRRAGGNVNVVTSSFPSYRACVAVWAAPITPLSILTIPICSKRLGSIVSLT